MIEIMKNTSFKNYDFVIYFHCLWDTPCPLTYLTKALAEKEANSKILCVERPVCLTSLLIKSPFRWIRQFIGGNKVRKFNDNLFVYRPWIFLNENIAATLPMVSWLNVNWLRNQLLSVMGSCGLNKMALVSLVADPLHENLIGMFGEKVSIFYCTDEFTSLKGKPYFRSKKLIRSHERMLLKKADITLVISDTLYIAKSPYANTIKIFPNAVDVRHFKPLDESELELPAEVLKIPKPIIGYLGGLSDRVDIPLLNMLSAKHLEWSFVLMGRLLDKIEKSIICKRFIERGNVYVLGSRPFEQLPRYLNAFNVCILPLDVNHPFNINCSPLKLYEYLATGKPIVSTDLPHVRKFKDVVRIGRNVDDIANLIKKCFNEKDSLKEKRIAMAKENTWEKRVTEMLTTIKDTIEENEKNY